MKIHHALLNSVVVSLSIGMSGCGSASSPASPSTSNSTSTGSTTLVPPPGATTAMLDDGARLFNGGSCQICHGTNGRNGPYGPDLTDQVFLHNNGSWEGIIATINAGVLASQFKSPSSRPEFFMQPRGGMSLSEDQLRSLGAYVWALSHR